MRIVGSSALFLSTSTGLVMAASPGCQVALRWETARAQKVLAHKAHHSAATLARWKVGAAAWSKTHHGKVYAGQQPVQAEMVWQPLTYHCEDIALVTDFAAPLLTGEALPEFSAYAAAVPSETSRLDIASAQDSTAKGDELLPSLYGGAFANMGAVSGPGIRDAPANGSAGSASFPLTPPEQTPGHLRLYPHRHPPQEVTLLPTPLPPPMIVPTPEPSTMVLLSTGLAALGLRRPRRSRRLLPHENWMA